MLSLEEFLRKYDFNQNDIDYIKDDFARGPKSNRRQTTKQLLANKKHSLCKNNRRRYMNDIIPFVPISTFNGWKLSSKIVTSNDLLSSRTKNYDCRLPLLEKQLVNHITRLQEYMGGYFSGTVIASEAEALFNKW